MKKETVTEVIYQEEYTTKAIPLADTVEFFTRKLHAFIRENPKIKPEALQIQTAVNETNNSYTTLFYDREETDLEAAERIISAQEEKDMDYLSNINNMLSLIERFPEEASDILQAMPGTKTESGE